MKQKKESLKQIIIETIFLLTVLIVPLANILLNSLTIDKIYQGIDVYWNSFISAFATTGFLLIIIAVLRFYKSSRQSSTKIMLFYLFSVLITTWLPYSKIFDQPTPIILGIPFLILYYEYIINTLFRN